MAQDTFIRRWGEMGATWGINRTMAEIHALLDRAAAIGRLLRDAKLYEIGAGTSEIRRMLIGRELFHGKS